MIETKDIKNMVAHIVRRDKGIVDPQIMHPAREWFIGLFVSFIIVICGSWFCYYVFTIYASKMSAPVVVTEPVVPYQAARIAEAIEIFNVKQQKVAEILAGKAVLREEVSKEKAIDTVGSTTTPVLIIDPAPPVSGEPELPQAMLAP